MYVQLGFGHWLGSGCDSLRALEPWRISRRSLRTAAMGGALCQVVLRRPLVLNVFKESKLHFGLMHCARLIPYTYIERGSDHSLAHNRDTFLLWPEKADIQC